MSISIDHTTLAALQRTPRSSVEGHLEGTAYTMRIAIPDYGARIERYYGRLLSELELDFQFCHFGLSIDFEKPVELAVHDDERRLDTSLRSLLNRFGTLTIRNAYLPGRMKSSEQRNVFRSLMFHTDRGHTQSDTISLFWRDHSDPVQRHPRSSSTLVLANATAYLQKVKEGHGEHEFKTQYELFAEENIDPLIGETLVELNWQAPEGVGEIALVDNLKVLHASYYAHPHLRGYPISVRYLF